MSILETTNGLHIFSYVRMEIDEASGQRTYYDCNVCTAFFLTKVDKNSGSKEKILAMPEDTLQSVTSSQEGFYCYN